MDSEKEPIHTLIMTKARRDRVPGGMKNKFCIDFLDENTYIDEDSIPDGIDFDENDFIEIYFGTEKRTITLTDLYKGDIASLK